MEIRSSYIENDFGSVLKANIMGWKPSLPVELGILDGYSTLHIAQGLKELHQLKHTSGERKFKAYDLFEDYTFKHGSKEEVEKMLAENGVLDYVEVIKGSAYDVHKNYANKSIDFLHVDISNTGKVLKDILELWHPKIMDKGLILFEGGSIERDNIEWMKKYNMPSIRQEILVNPIIKEFYQYGTYLKFPSLTVFLRKWW
jgi:predicted O-methyltransferase YrrM